MGAWNISEYFRKRQTWKEQRSVIIALLSSHSVYLFVLSDAVSSPNGMLDRSEVVSVKPAFNPGQNIEKANHAIAAGTAGRVFAVIMLSGMQFKVTGGDVIVANRLNCTPGSEIVFNKVLLAGTKDFSLVGTPLLSPNLVRVPAVVIEQKHDAKKISYYAKKKKRYRRKVGIRDHLTLVRIHDIQLKPNID